MTGFGKNRKLIARILLAVFFFAYFPFTGASGAVYAAPNDDDSMSSERSEDKTRKKDLEEKEAYTVTADSMPVYTPAKSGVASTGNAMVYDAPANTYVLKVGTGASAGDTVLYFDICYTDVNGNRHSEYIFPGVDAAGRSQDLVSGYTGKGTGLDKIKGDALEKIHYKLSGDSIENRAGSLDPWTVQDYVFQTAAEISRVDSIDLYLGFGQWSVQGIAVYKVDRFKGYDQYGLVSGQYFFDFEGYLLADLVKKEPGALTLSTKKRDVVFSIGGSKSDYFGIRNYKKNEKTQKFASEDSLYSFRLDISDLDGAGMSCFSNYSAKKVSEDIGVVENISIELQYKDDHGWARKATLPFVISSYLMVKDSLGNSTMMTFGDKGDTLAFQGMLPGFTSLVGGITLRTGETARLDLKEKGFTESETTAKMNENKDDLGKQTISLVGMSLYKGGCMPVIRGGKDSKGNHLEGATLEYAFESSQPILYYTTTDKTGLRLSSSKKQVISLREYRSGSPLIASSSADLGTARYLVTLSTGTQKKAGTTGDVSIRFGYQTLDGDKTRTRTYMVRSEAENFLGPWPSVSGGNYLKEYGLSEGASISFLIELSDLSEFTDADVRHLASNDEWVMNNLVVSYVESFSARRAYVATSDIVGTKYWVTRDMVTAEVFNLNKSNPSVYDENGNEVNSDGSQRNGKHQLVDENGNLQFDDEGNPVMVDDTDDGQGGRSGGQLFSGDKEYEIDFKTGKSKISESLNYSDVRLSMTYDQTQINWGFFKKRKTYDVTVSVAKDTEVDLGYGDAGSVNYFYFQLLFQNGNSAYVLANQQLAGDAFRSGKEEHFSISTNWDYGELQRIRIIAEDLSSDSKPFDKLNIDKVTVTERTTGGTNVSYVFDGIGWIDIDYRDEAEKASARGLQARTAEAIAKTFDLTYRERSVKLLCEVTTLPWDGDYNQFVGSIWAEIEYVQASDNTLKKASFDVVQCMAAYLDKSATTMEAATNVKLQTVKPAGQGSISDPEYMLRPGRTDKFIIPAITDLKSLKRITFTVQTKNNEAAIWNIGYVGVSQVLEDGPVQLTADGEVQRNMVTKRYATNKDSGIISKTLMMGIPEEIGPIEFTPNELVWTSEQWVTPVSRLPDSKNDTVNIFAYPTMSSANSDEGGLVTVQANLKYSIPNSMTMAAADVLKRGTDYDGNVVYSKTGLKARDILAPGQLTLKSNSSTLAFSKVIVQHVRDGVVMSNTAYNFLGNKVTKGMTVGPLSNNIYPDRTNESILLSFGGNTPQQTLASVENDIALAFSYKSTLDNGEADYQSPYVYLTDQGINSISEGLMAEVKFEIPYVKEITGYTLAGYGKVNGTVASSAAVVFHIDKEEKDLMGQTTGGVQSVRSYSSIPGSYVLTDRALSHPVMTHEMYGEDSLTPVTLTFTTTEDAKLLDNKANAAVRMILNYNDYMGTKRSVRIDDVTRYIEGTPKNFVKGEPQTVRLFLPEMSEDMTLQSLELLPYNPAVDILLPDVEEQVKGSNPEVDQYVTQMSEGTGIFADGAAPEVLSTALTDSRSASWAISKVEYDAGFGTNKITNDTAYSFLGMSNGGSVRLNSVALTTYVYKNNISLGQVKGRLRQLVAKGEDVISGTVTVHDSTAGFDIHAYRMVGDAGEEVTLSTLERDDLTRSFKFTVPKNTTGSVVIYKLEVSPVDAKDLIDTIYISVESANVGMETTIAVNDGTPAPVIDHASIVTAKGGDIITVKTNVIQSNDGITVWAYKVQGDVTEAVTKKTVEGLTAGGFKFKVPENRTGSTIQYRIEVAPQENYDAKDIIYLTVESEGMKTILFKDGKTLGSVKDHVKQLVAQAGEVIECDVSISNSDVGYYVVAYRMVGEAGVDVSSTTLSMNKENKRFQFTVPKNTTGETQIYKLEITPKNASNLKDQVYITVESVQVELATTLSLNGGTPVQVKDHSAIMLARGKDLLSVTTELKNTDKGIVVQAYRMTGNSGELITEGTVSDLSKSGFYFKVPTNKSGSVEQYKIEIRTEDDPNVKDTIFLSVESEEQASEESTGEGDTGQGNTGQSGTEPETPTSEE